MKGQPKLTCLCFFDYYGLSRKKRASFLPEEGTYSIHGFVIKV